VQTSARPPTHELAATLANAMPTLDLDEQELALALYRRLADGVPVSPGALAEHVGRERADVEEALGHWPGVLSSEDGSVIAFCGLAIHEMAHQFRVDGCRLFTWCAWDALFIPELIGRTAEVESNSPASGERVRVIIDPDGVRDVEPATAAVSMLSPPESFDCRVLTSFCHLVHFFSSPSEGEAWISEREGTFLLSVAEAHELGRQVNLKRFGALLTSARDKAKR
jgi:alkylmercury lyase